MKGRAVTFITVGLIGAIMVLDAFFRSVGPGGNVSAQTTVNNPRIVEDSTMQAGQKVTWDCIWFGRYPQTEIVGQDSGCGTYGKSWGEDSDYEVDSDLYQLLKNKKSGWSSNGDLTVNGTTYHRVQCDDATYGTTKDLEGYYKWNSESYHYFRYEPIKWRVLKVSGKKALLLADRALDDKRYNIYSANVTWKTSTLRSWMNGYGNWVNSAGKSYSDKNFINSAFTSSEKAAIQKTVLTDTEDNIFLLSESEVYGTDEAAEYGFTSEKGIYDEARRTRSSTFAKAMGSYNYSGDREEITGNCRWWLRTVDQSTCYSACVSSEGYVDGTDNTVNIVNCANFAVRPALNLDLSVDDCWEYAGTVCSDGSKKEKSLFQCGDHVYGVISGGTLSITGTGPMWDWSLEEKAPWYDDAKNIKNVEIKNGVTTIGNYAFENCGALKTVYFHGDPPSFREDSFGTQKAMTFYIPAENTGWTSETLKTYGAEKIRWVKYEPDSGTGVPFSRNADIWPFANSDEAFGDASQGYYITREDYKRFVSSLDRTEITKMMVGITKEQLTDGSYYIHPQYYLNVDGNFSYDPYGIGKYYMKWAGSCYGMSAWSCLVFDRILSGKDLSSYDALKDIKMSSKVESAINYYHFQQLLSGNLEAVNEFMKKENQGEQLKELETLALNVDHNREAILLGYQWYDEFDENGNCRKNSGHAHYVVGYGIESGNWEWTVNGAGNKYNKRILIYDCSAPDGGEAYDFYYNEDGVWCIPGRGIISTQNNSRDRKGNNGQLQIATTRSEYINAVDYRTGQQSAKALARSSGKSVMLETTSDAEYKVAWNNQTADISGFTVSDNTSGEPVNVCVESNVTSGNVSALSKTIAFLPEAEDYTITTKDGFMNYRLQRKDYYTAASIGSSGKIVFGPKGKVNLCGNKKSDFCIQMTAGENVGDIPWDLVSVNGKEATEIC